MRVYLNKDLWEIDDIKFTEYVEAVGNLINFKDMIMNIDNCVEYCLEHDLDIDDIINEQLEEIYQEALDIAIGSEV